MAHITKFKLSGMGQIYAHVNRDKNQTRKYENADIDTSKTYLNYDLQHGDIDVLTKRLGEVAHTKRHDLVACCGVVLTLPGELLHETQDTQQAFFKVCKSFLDKKFGVKNCVYATVHNDESTPHMHYGFVPTVVKQRKYRSADKKGQTYTQERVCAKEVVTKEMLTKLHDELQAHVSQIFPSVRVVAPTKVKRLKKNVSINELKDKTKESITTELECVKKQKTAILSDAEKKAEEILKSAEAEKQKQKEITEKLTKQALETEKEFLKFAKREISSGWHTHKESKGMFKKTVTISEQEYEDLYTAYDRHESYEYLQEQAHNYLANTVTGQETLNIRSKLRNQRELEESLKSAREEVAYKDRLLEHYKNEKSELENKLKLVTNIVLSVWEHLSDYVHEQLANIGIKKSRSFHR